MVFESIATAISVFSGMFFGFFDFLSNIFLIIYTLIFAVLFFIVQWYLIKGYILIFKFVGTIFDKFRNEISKRNPFYNQPQPIPQDD